MQSILYLYKKVDTFQKAKKLCYIFCIQTVRHFMICYFHENVEIGIYIQIQCNFMLGEVYIYINPDT